jgi:hypothetical protein
VQVLVRQIVLVCHVELPYLGSLIGVQSNATSPSGNCDVLPHCGEAASFDDPVDLGLPVARGRLQTLQRCAVREPGTAERVVHLAALHGHRLAAIGQETANPGVQVDEVDTVGQFWCQPTEGRLVHRGQRAHERREQQRPGAVSGQIPQPMESDHRLAGAGGAADPGRTHVVAGGDRLLVWMQKGHPGLERPLLGRHQLVCRELRRVEQSVALGGAHGGAHADPPVFGQAGCCLVRDRLDLAAVQYGGVPAEQGVQVRLGQHAIERAR